MNNKGILLILSFIFSIFGMHNREAIAMTRARVEGYSISSADADLLWASGNGDVVTAQEAINDGADVEVRDDRGWTPLRLACIYKRLDIIELLLNNGANIEASFGGMTSLMDACNSGYFDVVKMLIEHGADVHKCDFFGRTSLMYACQSGCGDTVVMILNAGVDVNARTKSGQTAYMFALNPAHSYRCGYVKDYPRVLKILVAHGAKKSWWW